MCRTLTIVAVLAVAVMHPITALAGGWAIVVLDEVPAGMQSGGGGPHRVGYTVLQHGLHPAGGLQTSVTIRSVHSGQSLSFPGRAEGSAGHYIAEVRFPSVGEWTWEVRPGPYPTQAMGAVTVLPKNLAHEGQAGTAASVVAHPVHEMRAPAALAWLRFPLVGAALLAWVLLGWSVALGARARGGSPGRSPRWAHPS
jgi:hypothetical protein